MASISTVKPSTSTVSTSTQTISISSTSTTVSTSSTTISQAQPVPPTTTTMSSVVIYTPTPAITPMSSNEGESGGPAGVDSTFIIIGCAAGGGALLLLVLLICCCCCCCGKRKTDRDIKNLMARQQARPNYYDIDAVIDVDHDRSKKTFVEDETTSTRKKPIKKILSKKQNRAIKEMQIDSSQLETGQVLGEGNFGVVYEGILRGKTEVAVKCMSSDSITDKTLEEFVNEVLRMRDFDHYNVLGVIGIVVEGNLPKVIMPKMELGDLKTFVADKSNRLTSRHLGNFGFQVAEGMEYLSTYGFIHRDLAARNCMLDKQHVVKISDFGLSRSLNERDYYKAQSNAPLPVRWMAAETLFNDKKFSVKSDVWSFGVLLWELFSRGQRPYPTLDNPGVMSYVRSGKRLAPPADSPADIYQVMLRCWAQSPSRRPTFRQLAAILYRFIQKPTTSVRQEDQEYENFTIED